MIGKPGCHLCDDARETIELVRGELAAAGITTEFEELDILRDAQLARVHAEHIPVVQINGKRHAIWRVDPARFRSALERAARGPFGALRGR
nr:glutaredoxin family protein [Leucobacter edaphi]